MEIYLDNSATTRQYDEVTDEMILMAKRIYGNPSSLHRMGIEAENAVNKARNRLAQALGASEQEVYFTGSGTEADNTALFGVASARKRSGNRIITTKAEHKAILSACARLEQSGFIVEYIGVDGFGRVDPAELYQRLGEDVILVSVMWVNNELGTVSPVEEIGRGIKDFGDIILHSDGIQAFGKLPVNLNNSYVDLLTVSGHKIHGPKGVGALYVRKDVKIEPYLLGGGQEKGFRSGTENTPGIAGLGVAAEKLQNGMDKRLAAMRSVRKYLLDGIIDEIDDVRINSPAAVYGEAAEGEPSSSPAILNVSFLGCQGEVLLRFLEKRCIYVSTGAACSSKKKANHVFSALGLSAENAVRFSFSEFNTIKEMDYVLQVLKETVADMRRLKRGR